MWFGRFLKDQQILKNVELTFWITKKHKLILNDTRESNLVFKLTIQTTISLVKTYTVVTRLPGWEYLYCHYSHNHNKLFLFGLVTEHTQVFRKSQANKIPNHLKTADERQPRNEQAVKIDRLPERRPEDEAKRNKHPRRRPKLEIQETTTVKHKAQIISRPRACLEAKEVKHATQI